ncbi:polysaccharide lyase 6 family protein [Ferruginibacter sp.]
MLLRILFLNFSLLVSIISLAKTIVVKNQEELARANKEAKPGDLVILQNGEWNNVILALNCNGTKEQPIYFKAQTPGKVLITGNSKLKIGGNYIIVDGLYFTNGYSDAESVITFRNNSDEIANNCRVTNTVINDFNNPKRLDANYWISFYGKKNRLDHCSFLNKKNLGVLLAVILDDERSRENFHLIDHNYFGLRIPLASNAGEIIRVGVSEHCQFNSNTQIIDNYFEHCDGETEIISIKSCKNIIRNNLFKECQGSVVLRHGNFNTVESNIFFGNNKEGTGGVRIINKGQWVVNNLFYKCRGVGFRSPMSIMNGIPNSPANRYLEVSEAVVSNNSFYECTPISFCEGSDSERTVQPYNVKFLNNLFYNSKDKQLYNIYDDCSRISFTGNLVSEAIQQELTDGFFKTLITTKNTANLVVPVAGINLTTPVPDSLKSIGKLRLANALDSKQGLSDINQLQKIINNASNACGAKWFSQKNKITKTVSVNCKTAAEVIQQINCITKNKLIINLTGSEYGFSTPLNINNDVLITTSQKQMIKFYLSDSNVDYFIQIKAGTKLMLSNIALDLTSSTAKKIITTDTSGSSNHCNFSMSNCSISNSNGTFFNAARSSVSDSILINNCSFKNGTGDVFKFIEETDNKGYYNVEKLKITNCTFADYKGEILGMLRSGRDESTMGPLLIFSNNKLTNCFTKKDPSLINIYGVQRSYIEKNSFINTNTGKTLILFEDAVRAVHILRNNEMIKSGIIVTDKFVNSENNTIH